MIEDITINELTNILNKQTQLRKERSEERKKSIENENTKHSAVVQYSYYTGSRNHLVRHDAIEVVFFNEGDKLISTPHGNKRLSSLDILFDIVDKKYKSVDFVLRQYKKQK